MKRLAPFIGILVLTVLVGGCKQQATSTSTQPHPVAEADVIIASDGAMIDGVQSQLPSPGDTAPDFRYTLPDGTVQKLSDLRGKKVILNFWATWCAPCQIELPEIQRISQTYSDDVVVLAINRAQTRDVIQPFIVMNGLTFPVIMNLSNDIGDAYGIRGLPTTYFIHTDGTISSQHIGTASSDVITSQIQELH